MKQIKEKNMIFGIRAVIEAIDEGKELDKVFIRREMGGDLAKELFDKLKDLQVPIQKVPLEKLNNDTFLEGLFRHRQCWWRGSRSGSEHRRQDVPGPQGST